PPRPALYPYTTPFRSRRSEVTYRMIHDVLDALKKDRPALSPLRVWRAYAHLDDVTDNEPVNELTALVALIRRVCELDDKLTPHSDRKSTRLNSSHVKI